MLKIIAFFRNQTFNKRNETLKAIHGEIDMLHQEIKTLSIKTMSRKE